MNTEALDEVITIKLDRKMEGTFQYYIFGLYKLLGKTKKDIDETAINDLDQLKIDEMRNAWKKASQAVKKIDEEIFDIRFH
jgi:hypothetical protein